MDRRQFSSLWSMAGWILIFVGWFTGAEVFGISVGWLVLPMIFLRGPVVRAIYGPVNRGQTAENNQVMYPERSQEQPLCPTCGATARRDARFCEECGTSLTEQPSTTFESFK